MDRSSLGSSYIFYFYFKSWHGIVIAFHMFMYGAITHPGFKFNGGLAKTAIATWT